MKYIVKIFVLVICMFQFNYVFADECTDSQINNLKELAEAIQIDVEFDYDSVDFGIYNRNIVTVQNLHNDLYIMSDDNSFGIFPSNAVDGIITKYFDSDVTNLKVYSNSCENIVFRTIKLAVKQYNLYAGYEECQGISGDELDVCDEFYDGSISYEEFVKKINEYKNKQNSDSDDVAIKLSDYYGAIIGVAILIVILVVILVVRNIKRNRLD